MWTVRFPARRRFAREPIGGPRPFDGVAFADSVLTVEAAPLDHRIISMAYAGSERTPPNVRPDALAAAGPPPRQGRNVLQTAVRAGAGADTPHEVLPG